MGGLARQIGFVSRVAIAMAMVLAVAVGSLAVGVYARQPDPWLWVVVYATAASVTAIVVVLLLAARFVQGVHGVERFREALGYLIRCVFGQVSFSPWLLVLKGQMARGQESLLARIGGPGFLIVYNDSAVVLERAGRFTKVVGRGCVFLDQFEKVWDVIDLRPQRWNHKVDALTKDGIPVQCEADVTFKIDDGGKKPTEKQPYPFSEEAVFKAATSKWVREAHLGEADRVLDWAGRLIIGAAEGTLRTILSRYLLDRLIEPLEEGVDHPRKVIRDELERELRKAAPTVGAKIMRVDLGAVRVKEEVTKQWIEGWQAEWQRRTMIQTAEGEAERVRLLEAAQAGAQVELILSITQAFQTLVSRGVDIPDNLIALRLVETLRRISSEDPWLRMNLPLATIRNLALLRDMIK